MTYEFATPEPPKLRIAFMSGRIQIEAGDTAQTVVEAEASAGNDESLRVEQRGREIVIEQKRRFGFNRDEYDVRVTVPHGAEADISVASADIRSSGRLGSFEVKSASGEIEVEAVERDARIRSASGDVRIESVGGKADVNTASGAIKLGTVGGETSVRSASGTVSIGEALTGVTINTASGDQTITSVAVGKVDLKSASGDCRIGIKKGSRLFVDARSMSGKTISEVELDGGGTSGDGPLVEVRAATMSGDIRVVRA